MAGLTNVEDFMDRGLTRAEALTKVEELVFGAGAERDPVTGRVFEQGIGALPREIQARHFLEQRKREQDSQIDEGGKP